MEVVFYERRLNSLLLPHSSYSPNERDCNHLLHFTPSLPFPSLPTQPNLPPQRKRGSIYFEKKRKEKKRKEKKRDEMK
jgi:hypothetical protein